MESILQDLRYGVRILLKSPIFTITIVLTLAIAAGGNTAIFSVLNNTFFRPLPLQQADRLVRLRDFNLAPDGQRNKSNIGDDHFLKIRSQQQVFQDVAAMQSLNLTLTGTEEPERISVVAVSPKWATTMGVTPIVGRAFLPSEEEEGFNSRSALIGYGLWQRHFGGNAELTNKTLKLNNQDFKVIGVLPQGFKFPYDGEVWLPATIKADGGGNFAVFARLKDNITLAQADDDLKRIATQLKESDARLERDYGIDIMPMRESLIGDEDRLSLALSFVASFFLLLACANVANLLLSRSFARQKEIAVRAALGATRTRQIRQFLTESLLLAVAGSLAGLLLALFLEQYLVKLIPLNLARQLSLNDISLDYRLFGFSLAVIIITTITAGLLPAVRLTKPDLLLMIKESGQTITESRRNRRWLNLFVIGQCALAIALLTGATLSIRQIRELQNLDLGFQADNLLTMQLTLPGSRYTNGEQRAAFVQQSLEKISALPGVKQAGITTINPLKGWTWDVPIVLDRADFSNTNITYSVNHRYVSPELFGAMNIPLIKGRLFNQQDRVGSENVVIISQRMAQHFWPQTDPIGQRIKIGPNNSEAPWMSIIGVVADVKDSGDNGDTWYLPYYQQAGAPGAQMLHLMIRTEVAPTSLARAIQRTIWGIDNNLAVYDVATMAEIYADTIAPNRLSTILIAIFALFGLLLASLGVYAVMSHSVNRRIRELGIRIALGAQPRDIVKLVLGEGLKIITIGVIVGFFAAYALTRLMNSYIDGLNNNSFSTSLMISSLLIVAALVACYLPARRAMRVDPIVALREE